MVAAISSSPAIAHPGHDAGFDGSAADDAHDTHQHGDTAGHLPPTQNNVDLISKLRLKNVVPEKIADVGVHKGYAYLAAWGVVTCKYNGVHVVDIRNPQSPKEVAFVQSKEGSYPGEGIQAIALTTPYFSGDILVSNNEKCLDKTTRGFGGMNIYDVTDPRHPTPLAVGAGDTSEEGTDVVAGAGKKDANEIHSVFAWDAGDKAYAVIVDNEEATDVDIMDITNPKAPVLVAEYDLAAKFPQIVQNMPDNLTEIFFHDVVVKKVGSRFMMSASYWDAGYVILDVTDVRNPTYVGDSDYALEDPALVGTPFQGEAPEGNGHQSEWTRDNRYLIGTDEDFSPYRSGPFFVDGTEYDAVAVGGGGSPADLPDKKLNGPVVYGGYGCPDSAPVPPASTALAGVTLAAGEEKIVVLQRGPSGDPGAPEQACFPGDKAASAFAAGYDAVVLVNRHLGSAEADFAYCGSGGFPQGLSFPTVCTTHAAFHDLFNVAPNFSVPYAGAEPAIGAIGDKVSVEAFFNGWGYVHLFRNGAGKLADLDQYVVPEAIDPAYAKGFGDLSVHEVATSAMRDDLAYISYYAAGFRVTKIVNDQLVEVGRFIDQGGNNFWGVQVFTGADGNEYVAASDRDFGLYIFRYTGG
ncbi:MAG: hypothetical protein ABIS44_08045 [Mycobacteriales bacterium]